MKNLYVIIPAAGIGKRLGLGKNKAFAIVGGLPLLVQCVRAVAAVGPVKQVVAAVGAAEVEATETLLRRYSEYYPNLAVRVVAGGPERADSVFNALQTLPDDGYVAVHDGARPFVTPAVFDDTYRLAQACGAAIAAVPVKNTIKVADAEGYVQATPHRGSLFAVQTPQIFATALLKKAYAQASGRAAATDDASLVEQLGVKVAFAKGSYENIKITTPEDLLLAEKICDSKEMRVPNMRQFRVGSGYDVHKLVLGRRLILCGIEVPYELGLLGHSDADVAAHALMDALLGAAALGDIGKHFPDTDSQYAGADSMVLLATVADKLKRAGWQLNNADITIIAQKPKLAAYIPAMRTRLCEVLAVSESCLNVKATTTEQLGFTGRGEGIAAEACVSLCGSCL